MWLSKNCSISLFGFSSRNCRSESVVVKGSRLRSSYRIKDILSERKFKTNLKTLFENMLHFWLKDCLARGLVYLYQSKFFKFPYLAYYGFIDLFGPSNFTIVNAKKRSTITQLTHMASASTRRNWINSYERGWKRSAFEVDDGSEEQRAERAGAAKQRRRTGRRTW